MGLLRKLKSVFGMDGPDEEGADVAVTVERRGSEETVERPVASDDAGASADASGGTPAASDAAPETTDESAGAGGSPSEVGGDAEPTEPPSGDPVTDVKGIGPSYGESLGDVGVETVPQLAAADPDEVAEQTGISAKRISRWVERAKHRGQ
ncbi:MAG: helix-hairpin-helix domain-containing protein [Halobacteriaceae archaeon]